MDVWKLLEHAEQAEDTASGLQVFLKEIPQCAKDITAQIAELFAISHALRDLHERTDLSRHGRAIGRILDDLELVLPSLKYTLNDVREMFTKSKGKHLPGAFPGTPQYHLIWEDACAEFKAQGMPLPMRLEFYRNYLQDMADVLEGEAPDEDVHLRIRPKLERLLTKQVPVRRSHQPPPPPPPPPPQYQHQQQHHHHHAPLNLDSYFGNLNLGDPHPYAGPAQTPRPKSPSVPRPKIPKYGTYPTPYPIHSQPPFAIPPPPPPPPPPPLPLRPHSPYGEVPYVPPPVPEVTPQSPTYSSASSHTFSAHSNDSGAPAIHWGVKIFDGRHSSTPFQTLGNETRCLGTDEPRALQRLEGENFMQLLELPFEAAKVLVRLYWRSKDSRARILFLTHDPSGGRLRFCFPLTGLKIIRNDSCLQLCRLNQKDGELYLWANLRFALYERMVLFYCVLVALKRQDEVPSAADDFFQPGEKEEFGGEVQDGNYLHAFRIFRDRDSGGVRFEVKPRRGPSKFVPIWTAFVTQFIGKQNWVKRIGHTTVQFRELHPYVFCDGYRPPRGQSGRYTLTFTSPEDTIHFLETFHHIKSR